jgi:hypothetical protein
MSYDETAAPNVPQPMKEFSDASSSKGAAATISSVVGAPYGPATHCWLPAASYLTTRTSDPDSTPDEDAL